MSSNLTRVKPMTYTVDTCHYLAWCLALIEYDKDLLTQRQDNVTVWDVVTVAWFLTPCEAEL